MHLKNNKRKTFSLVTQHVFNLTSNCLLQKVPSHVSRSSCGFYLISQFDHSSLAPLVLCRYLALYAYEPQKADELELRKGEMYRVTEKCQDGWFKGTSLRTAASGVFPGNYVTPVSRSVSSEIIHIPRALASY